MLAANGVLSHTRPAARSTEPHARPIASRFPDRNRRTGQSVTNLLEVLNGGREGSVDTLAHPHWIGMNEGKVHYRAELVRVSSPSSEGIRRADGLGDGRLYPGQVLNHRINRNPVIVPVDKGFVTDVDGDDDVFKLGG